MACKSLREKIASLYAGATADNVLVTIGASEANTLVAATLLQSGDNIIRFRPTYEQLSGNGESWIRSANRRHDGI